MKIDPWKIVVAGLLSAGLAVPALAGTVTEKARAKPGPHPAPTVEPAPPVSLDIRLVNLQKNVRGGVAALSLDTASTLDLDDVTLEVKLPEGVMLSDGTKTRAWTFNLTRGAPHQVPAELLVAADGKYVLSASVRASYQGRPIHRGCSFRLLVGVQDKNPQSKDGAIEYPGVPGGER